jgi:hypothetical protein
MALKIKSPYDFLAFFIDDFASPTLNQKKELQKEKLHLNPIIN